MAQLKAGEPVDTCRALKALSASRTEVRGLAEVMEYGWVIGDATCPVISTKEGRQVPGMILVQIESFASERIQNQYMRLTRLRDIKSVPLLQVVVRGMLECKPNMQFEISDDGADIVGGAGYGPYGLIKCRLNHAELLVLEQLDARGCNCGSGEVGGMGRDPGRRANQ